MQTINGNTVIAIFASIYSPHRSESTVNISVGTIEEVTGGYMYGNEGLRGGILVHGRHVSLTVTPAETGRGVRTRPKGVGNATWDDSEVRG